MRTLSKIRSLPPVLWGGLVALTLAGDYATGPHIHFPILYIVPVVLATMSAGRAWGFALAFAMPMVRVVFAMLWNVPWSIGEAAVNEAVQTATLLLVAFFTEREVQRRALAEEVRILRGLLPICMFCKRIRDRDDNWESLETYIARHSEARFSHGLCPPCGKEHYGRFLENQAGR